MPSNASGPIDRFVTSVGRRVNRHRLWTALIWAAVVAAGLVVAIGLFYTIQGDAVPGAAIGLSLAISGSGALAFWGLRRLSGDRAARYADRFFRLQDAVTSYLHFSRTGHRDGFFALQAKKTHAQVSELDLQRIAYRPPRRGLWLAAGLAVIAVPLSLRGPSPAVLEQLRLEEATEVATTALNEDLAQEVDALREEAVDPDEKELLDPDKLRRWVDELKTTKDPKKALRQYAALERKLNEARLAVQRKRDEQLLDRAAKELERSEETKPLAERLAQKKYDQAAEDLAKMAPQQDRKLDGRRRDLARLKAVSQRMASAVHAARSSSSGSKFSSANRPRNAEKTAAGKNSATGKPGASGSTGDGSGGGELSEAIEDLADSVEGLDDALDEAARQESQHGECDEKQLAKCQACQQEVCDQLGRISKALKKLAICRRAEKKLGRLCRKCSQCQSGLCSATCSGPNAGGLKPGWGSNTARRAETDELIDNGQTTALKGIKGSGPSLTTVESTDDGSGVSTRRSTTRQRDYRRQFEAFVAREDVPEPVKEGVKQYFQIIHQVEPEK